MKIVVFGPERRVGALVGERVIDLNRGMARQLQEQGESKAEEQAATRLPARLLTFIESGPPALENAQRVIDQFDRSAPGDERGELRLVHNVSDVKLHAPWPERRIACVGGNYAAHLAGMWANRLGKTDVSIEQITEEARKGGQWGFWKVPAEVAGPADTHSVSQARYLFRLRGRSGDCHRQARQEHSRGKDTRLCLGCDSIPRLEHSRRRRNRSCGQLQFAEELRRRRIHGPVHRRRRNRPSGGRRQRRASTASCARATAPKK